MSAAATTIGLSTPWILLSLAILPVSIALVYLYLPPTVTHMADNVPASIYDNAVKDISGSDVKLSEYAGKVLLIVNVASKCGLTNSNYKELNVLYDKYRGKGLEILAFPCNQFAGQEPGSNEDIQETVCTRFKAEFPIFDKNDIQLGIKMTEIDSMSWRGYNKSINLTINQWSGQIILNVDVNGKEAAPLYKFLKSKKGGFLGDGIKWNFTKFLVDKDGKVVERYAPTTSPLKIENDIQKLLSTS
ncbi:hypothetical protein QOZ80_9AG0677450 [Eleusine coracana subsp. coracana]|nr:hypothetical protein QOZ80_9AG0677450 [Eleusine coracana subsp. coracana]